MVKWLNGGAGQNCRTAEPQRAEPQRAEPQRSELQNLRGQRSRASEVRGQNRRALEIREHKERPLKNTPFCPISASDSNFNPQNTRCISVVKIFVFLVLEQN